MMISTIILVIIVSRLIKAAQKTANRQADNKNTKTTILTFIGIYCVMILFATIWFCGTLFMNPISNSFQILFAIFNLIQTFCYFTFIVLFKEEGRKFWINLLKPRSCKRWSIATITSGLKCCHPSHSRRDDGLELNRFNKGANDDHQNNSYSPSSSTVTDLKKLDPAEPGR